ncbi:MAG: porin family protein [Bacteroidaceae bacterium]|nr:porin family protein [Bacteroidaceae bacterium]
MKRSLSFIFVLLVALSASAKINFGVKGGINIAKLSFSSDVFSSTNNVGWFIGPTIKIGLPLGFGVDAAALYDQRTTEIEYNGTKGTEKVKHHAINIPVNLRYNIGLGSMLSLFLKAGPQIGFNVGDKNPLTDYKDFTWSGSEFSVNFGLGFTLIKHVEIAANYNLVCGKTGEIDSLLGNLSRVRANAWQISAAYYF